MIGLGYIEQNDLVVGYFRYFESFGFHILHSIDCKISENIRITHGKREGPLMERGLEGLDDAEHVIVGAHRVVVHKQLTSEGFVVEVVDHVLRIAETVVTIEIARPENNDTITKTICLTDEERAISYLIETDD